MSIPLLHLVALGGLTKATDGTHATRVSSRLLLIAEAEMIKGLVENYSSESTGLRRACAYAGRSPQLVRPRNDLLLALSHYLAGRERDTSLFLCIDIHRESLVALRRSKHTPSHTPEKFLSCFPRTQQAFLSCRPIWP